MIGEAISGPAPAAAFHASTGLAAYDAIAFGARPIAQPVVGLAGSVQIVRHLGVECQTPVSLHYCNRDYALMIIDLRNSGDYLGMVDGAVVSKKLKRSTVSFLPAGTDLRLEFPAAHSAMVMFLPQAMIDGILHDLGDPVIRPRFSEEMPRVAQLARMIEAELATAGGGSAMMIEGLVRAIVTGLCSHDPVEADPVADRIYLPPSKLKRVVEFVDAHVDEPISLTDLANLAGLSQFHFARVFKRANGETPCQFIRARRLERARTLLATTQMPLAELSLACGFANQSHFTAAFSRAMGISPARYRRLVSG